MYIDRESLINSNNIIKKTIFIKKLIKLLYSFH